MTEKERTTKLLGSIRRSVQVPGHPEVAYEFPAQSPAYHSKVVSADVYPEPF